MATKTRLEYGTYTHGKPFLSNDRCWRRVDTYAPHSGQEGGRDNLFAASGTDDSPIHNGPYNPECSCCWLNFPHTTAAHNARCK